MGVKCEQAIAKLIESNDTMEKLGIQFETLNARIRTQEKLQSNYDKRELPYLGAETSWRHQRNFYSGHLLKGFSEKFSES